MLACAFRLTYHLGHLPAWDSILLAMSGVVCGGAARRCPERCPLPSILLACHLKKAKCFLLFGKKEYYAALRLYMIFGDPKGPLIYLCGLWSHSYSVFSDSIWKITKWWQQCCVCVPGGSHGPAAHSSSSNVNLEGGGYSVFAPYFFQEWHT